MGHNLVPFVAGGVKRLGISGIVNVDDGLLAFEELESHAFGRIHLQNLREEYSVLLYEEDGVLYYLDPVEETVYRSALTVEELRAFLAA